MSLAAQALAKALPASHRVVAITETEFGYFPPASSRASVVPGWEHRTTASVDGIFPKGSRHVLLSCTKVLWIEPNLHTLHVAENHPELGFGLEIPFEFIVIVTGSINVFPARPPRGALTMAAVTAAHQIAQLEVAAATSVLIIGGGAMGVEFTGEVKSHHPTKSGTLVASSARLVPRYPERVGKSLEKQLEATGVNLVFGTRVNTAVLKSGPIPLQAFDAGGREGLFMPTISFFPRERSRTRSSLPPSTRPLSTALA